MDLTAGARETSRETEEATGSSGSSHRHEALNPGTGLLSGSEAEVDSRQQTSAGERHCMREIFSDWPTRIGTLLLLLIAGVVSFNTFSDLPMDHPLLGVFSYGMVPALWAAGAVVFLATIIRKT